MFNGSASQCQLGYGLRPEAGDTKGVVEGVLSESVSATVLRRRARYKARLHTTALRNVVIQHAGVKRGVNIPIEHSD